MKKVLAGCLAALLIASSASMTTVAASKGTTAQTKQTTQSTSKKVKKVVKKKKASSKAEQSTDDESETDWQEEMLKSINAQRKKAGVAELKLDEALCEAAQIRADECLKSYSHTRPNGKKFTTVLDDKKIKYGYWGENINEKQESVSSTMKSWMSSEGHKANILKKEFDTVGFGRTKDSKGKYYWVQIFISAK